MSSGDTKEKNSKIINQNSDELRRGPWTLEEDNLLISYITCHGEGRWNSLAKCAGLKRTGKSCRLRWLNYLKPDIKRGDLSPHEQILILELHSRWGNRWSKIAQHLPGRTDNEIKNYWRTRVQKQARQLKIDSNSNKFLDTIRRLWMPRLIEKVEQKSSETSSDLSSSPSSSISTVEAVSQKLIASHDYSTVPVLINQVSGDNSNNNLESNDRSSVKSEKPEIPVNHWNLLLTESKECDKIFCGESMEDDDDRYRVGFPRYDVQESLTGRHVEEYDWLEDEFKSASFWNTDELWMGVDSNTNI